MAREDRQRLIIEEQDGSPSVKDVNTIVFNNSTVTDDGAGQVTIDVDLVAIDTFPELTDVTAPYNNVGALTVVNGTSDGMTELTTLVTEPEANQFQIARGTSALLVQGDLTVESDSFINQDLTTDADVTFNTATVGLGALGTPAISFGDGDTGLYEASDDDLRVAVAGTSQWQMNGTTFGSAVLFQPKLVAETCSGTNPTVIPNNTDDDTGLGRASVDAPSMVAGGVEAQRWTESAGVITSNIYGSLTIGAGAAGIDYTLTFNGETNDGVLTWMEDESVFDFDSEVTINDDTDGTTILGRAKIGSPVTDVAYFAHYDRLSTADYALKQLQDGSTQLNARSGKTLIMSIGNANKSVMTSTETKHGDGGVANYLEINSTGDATFVGSAGLPFGEIYVYEAGATITIAGTGVANKVQVTAFDTNGQSNNTTPDHTNDHITIDKGGKYMVTISMSIESTGGTSYTLSAGLWKNNGATQFQNVHMSRQLSGGGGDVGSTSMSGICDFALNDTVELWVWNETNTNNVIVDDVTLSITQIGG